MRDLRGFTFDENTLPGIEDLPLLDVVNIARYYIYVNPRMQT
jgi:hypothetical protein